MAPTVPQMAELHALPDWRTVDFISDLHLHASEPATFAVWRRYMQSTPADAVFILGDLFEVWVGDDALQSGSFELQCADVIRQTAARIPVFFMHGNRDFLVGNSLMAACNTSLLADPSVLIFNNQRWLLSHGDALCIDDVPYMQFRAQVRSPEWQQTFLAKPLAERQAIARGLRQQSEARKQSGAEYADVDSQAARQLLQNAHSLRLIHGHTHKPAEHDLGDSMRRVVLSDWDADAQPARAEVLRLSADGLQRITLV
jgi:UDP-2,3-diacylglucosamine hydrolase